jgi:hypothetical protein
MVIASYTSNQYITMKKFGPSSRKFSRLDDAEGMKPQEHSYSHEPFEQGEQDGNKTNSPSSRGKRMIQSVACVTGSSPKRMPLEDDDNHAVYNSSSRHLQSTSTKSKAAKEHVSNQSRKKKLDLKVNEKHDLKAQEQGDDSQEAPLRQQQLDDAMQTVISSEKREPPATQEYQAVGLKIQPSYDDVVLVFQSPSSDAGTQVSRGSKDRATRQVNTKGEHKVKPSPAKPVILYDDNDGEEAIIGSPAISRAMDAPTGGTQHDSYSHVESLIARVKKLDAVVKAGEEEEVARVILQEKEASCSDSKETCDGTVESENFVLAQKPETTEPAHDDKSIGSSPNEGRPLRPQSPIDTVTSSKSVDESKARENGSPPFSKSHTNEPRSTILKPIVSPPHDSPPHRYKKSNRSVTPSVDEKESTDDGANHFRVIYRRGDDSPKNSHVKTMSVATTTASSIVTVSSFGIPGIESVQKTTAIVIPIRHRQLRTSHPFFWRTHPKEVFTSYSRTPNRQKTLMAPLRGTKGKTLSTGRVGSNGPTRSSRQLRMMRTVEESGGKQHEFRATNPYTFWSKERDPVDNEMELLEDGASDFSPYGDKTASAHQPEPDPLSLVSSGLHASSDSNTWMVFSEFSVSLTEEFR